MSAPKLSKRRRLVSRPLLRAMPRERRRRTRRSAPSNTDSTTSSPSSRRRRQLSLLSPMTLIPLSLLSSCPLCAERWVSHTSLSRQVLYRMLNSEVYSYTFYRPRLVSEPLFTKSRLPFWLLLRSNRKTTASSRTLSAQPRLTCE
jgi:hypothetical protein